MSFKRERTNGPSTSDGRSVDTNSSTPLLQPTGNPTNDTLDNNTENLDKRDTKPNDETRNENIITQRDEDMNTVVNDSVNVASAPPRTPPLQVCQFNHDDSNAIIDDEDISENDSSSLTNIPCLPLSPPKHILRRLTPIGLFSPSSHSLYSDNTTSKEPTTDTSHEQRKLKLLNEKIAKLGSYSRQIDEKVNSIKSTRIMMKEDNCAKLQKKLENAQKLRDNYIEKKRKVASLTCSTIQNKSTTNFIIPKDKSQDQQQREFTFPSLAPPKSFEPPSPSFMRNVANDDSMEVVQVVDDDYDDDDAEDDNTYDKDFSSSIIPLQFDYRSQVSENEVIDILRVLEKFPQFTKSPLTTRRLKYDKAVNFVNSKLIIIPLVKLFDYYDVIGHVNVQVKDKLNPTTSSFMKIEKFVRCFLFSFLVIVENYQYLENKVPPSYDTFLDSGNFNYTDLMQFVNKNYLDDSLNKYLVSLFVKSCFEMWTSFIDFFKVVNKCSSTTTYPSSTMRLRLRGRQVQKALNKFLNVFTVKHVPLFQLFKIYHKKRSLLLAKRSIYELQRHGFYVTVSLQTEDDPELIQEYTALQTSIENELSVLHEQCDLLSAPPYDGRKRHSRSQSKDADGDVEIDTEADDDQEFDENSGIPASLIKFSDFDKEDDDDEFNHDFYFNELNLSANVLNKLEKKVIEDHDRNLLKGLLSSSNPIAMQKPVHKDVFTYKVRSKTVNAPMTYFNSVENTSSSSDNQDNDETLEFTEGDILSSEENATNIFDSLFKSTGVTEIKRNTVLVPPQFTVLQWREHLMKLMMEYKLKRMENGEKDVGHYMPKMRTGRESNRRLHKSSSNNSSSASFLNHVENEWVPDVDGIREYLNLKSYEDGYIEFMEKVDELDGITHKQQSNEDNGNRNPFYPLMSDISNLVFRAFHSLYIVVMGSNGKISIVLPYDGTPSQNIYDSFRMKHKGDISHIVNLVFLMKRFKNGDITMHDYFGKVLNILANENCIDYLQDEIKNLIGELDQIKEVYERSHASASKNAYHFQRYVFLGKVLESVPTTETSSHATEIDRLINAAFIKKFVGLVKDCLVFGMNQWVYNCSRMAVIYKSGNGLVQLERKLAMSFYTDLDSDFGNIFMIENKFRYLFDVMDAYPTVEFKSWKRKVTASSRVLEDESYHNFFDDIDMDIDLNEQEDEQIDNEDTEKIAPINCFDYFNTLFIEYLSSSNCNPTTFPEQFDSFKNTVLGLKTEIESIAATQAIVLIIMSDVNRSVLQLPSQLRRTKSHVLDHKTLLKDIYSYFSSQKVYSSVKGWNVLSVDYFKLSKTCKDDITNIIFLNAETCLKVQGVKEVEIKSILDTLLSPSKISSLLDKSQYLLMANKDVSLRSVFTGYIKQILQLSLFKYGQLPSDTTKYVLGDENMDFEHTLIPSSSPNDYDDYVTFEACVYDTPQDMNQAEIARIARMFKDDFMIEQVQRLVMKYYAFFNLCFEVNWLTLMAVFRRWCDLITIQPYGRSYRKYSETESEDELRNILKTFPPSSN